MKEFINEWGSLIKNITTILLFLGMIIAFFKKLNGMDINLKKIPNIEEELKKATEDITLIKEKQTNSDDVILEVKTHLEQHCSTDKKKQKMALDMARQCLLNEMEKAIKDNEVTVSRKAVIGELYDSYVDNGGNGAVHNLWTEFIHLPLK